MSTMQRRLARRDDVTVRREEHDDRTVIVADFGPGTSGHTDLVDDTLIVVSDGEQREFELPASEVRASMTNGVLTVEMNEVEG